MTKKTIGILLIILVMFISISAISATDTNETLFEEVSDTDIETTSLDYEEGNVTSYYDSEDVNDVEELKVDDKSDEISTTKEVKVDSSSKGDLLSASNDDVLGANQNFWYNGQWYTDLDDAVDDACDNNGGTIYLTARAWGYDSAEREITISDGVTIIFEPYSPGDEVIFDGQNHKYWFFVISHANAQITFNHITFRNGEAREGGAIEVEHGQLNLNYCTFEGNKAVTNIAQTGYGWGGAIFLDESDASLIARNCQFKNNNAGQGGGAVCAEDGSSARFEYCSFEGNTAPAGNDVHNKDGGTHEFYYCDFKGSIDGDFYYEVDYAEKKVTMTPHVNDEVTHAVLYKNGKFYDRLACTGNGVDTATFTDLEEGSYTIYMMKNEECKYSYPKTTFIIINNSFVLNGTEVFENLSAAINAIPDGGSGEITVAMGTYSGAENFNVEIINKVVTIRPKDDSYEPVIFSSDSQYNLFSVGSNGQLIMEDIIVTGKFHYEALDFNNALECTITDCTFNNTLNYQDSPAYPIYARNSNLGIYGCTFESNGNLYLGTNAIATIDDCTFDSNSGGGFGGAIWASTDADLTITNSEFKANSASRGGAIYANNLKINDTVFMGNSADTGGAIYITWNGNSEINITGCVFDTNIATDYRNIYSQSLTRKINLADNEYDLNLTIIVKDGTYGLEYVLDGNFDWGSNLNNNYTILSGILDDNNVFGDIVTVEDNKFKINLGILSGGTHEFTMSGIDTQSDSNDHFYGHEYYYDLNGNEFYLNKEAYAKILIDKAKIILNLEVKNVLIPEIPVLNLYANFDENFTVFLGTTTYNVQVVNGKGSLQLTGLDLGNYTVVAMRGSDENFELALNFTTFSVSKTYSNFLVVSTNVEYDTLKEAVANSDDADTILIKKGTYGDTGIVISNKTISIVAMDGAVFDAQSRDANFIIVKDTAEVTIYGITFRGIQNRNTNYGAIVNYGYLTVDSCNFIDNKITKTSFAENGGAAIFSNGESLDIDNCTFINNVAPLKASTAAVTSLGYDEVSITDSKFINNSAREGGAVHLKNIIQFEEAILSCEFEHNVAVKGSAIFVGNNSRFVSVSSSNFNKNDIKNNNGENAQLEGGVIYVNANDAEVTLNIDLSSFESNSNNNVDGGVICLDGISSANIDTCIFDNNKGKLGSVILVKNPENEKLRVFIDSSTFTNNVATKGAIAASSKVTVFLDDCIFGNNTGEYRNIYSNGFTVAHETAFDVKDVKLNALNVKYGENSIISGTVDIGANIYAAANLTVAGENVIVDVKDNAFTYKTDILSPNKYYAVLNGIVDLNSNTYVMDSVAKLFRVKGLGFDLNVSVDNITYGENIKVIETHSAGDMGTITYQLNGISYTKEELESLKLDAGKYSLVAYYNHDGFKTYTVIDFEVYKANPTISVANVEVKSGESIIVNIESDAPSIYTIVFGEYNLITLINGSKSIEVENTFAPGNYTIQVTSQERVNYLSGYAEATLTVNGALLDNTNNVVVQSLTSLFGSQSPIDEVVLNKENINKFLLNSKDGIFFAANNDMLRDEESSNFMYQEDEDSEYTYFDNLEDAIDEAILNGEGIITVRGGTYTGYGNCGIEIEGEVELTIKAYEGEVVIFDCGNEYNFLYLTYETEVDFITYTPPVPYTYQTEGPTITLENITIINGYSDGDGGAIEMDAGTLTLNNCNFNNNNADGDGGAIYIGSSMADEDAMVIAVNTTFTNNYAKGEGGAIYISSGLQDTSASFGFCTFLDNFQGEDRKMNYFAGEGVEDITSKYCVFNGTGEIYSVVIDKINQTVTIKGTSPDHFDSIALMYFDYVPIYTVNTNGSQNFHITFEEVMGGNYTVGTMNGHQSNIYLFATKFEVIEANFIISENETYEYLIDAIGAVEENGIIYANYNYYDEENMEIAINKSFTLKNFRDRVVVFDGNNTKWFFTVPEGYNVVFEGINFTDGGIKTYASFENNGTLTFKNCTFTDFEADAIIYNTGFLTVSDSEFSDNFLNHAIVLNDGKLSVDSAVFASNVINVSSVILNNGIADITSSNFKENINYENGGAIYSINSLNIKDTVFSDNEGINGGAVYSTGTMKVENSTFEDNTANGYGGAIYSENELNVINSSFTGGYAEIDGGAIYINNITVVNNSSFVANTANGKGGAIYNNKSLELKESAFGINTAFEFANIYNAGDIQFTGNTFDFYDVILHIPDGQYGVPSIITGTLDPQFNMDLQLVLPGFVNNADASVNITEGIFEYNTSILPKGIYDVILNEIIYDTNGNIYYGEAVIDRLIIHKANIYLNLVVDDIVLKDATQAAPVLKINASKDGIIYILFNNKFSNVNITGGYTEIALDSVEEGNYSVMGICEGDENYNDAVNTTAFTVSDYEGNFIVNSTGSKYDHLSEAIFYAAENDIIYVNEGTYSLNYSISVNNRKLTITSLGEVVFDVNSTNSRLAITETSDVTLENIVITGFNKDEPFINNKGNLTVNGCIFVNNLCGSLINSSGNLTIVESAFYNNVLSDYLIYIASSGDVIINESTFENNTVNNVGNIIGIDFANSVKIISNAFVKNRASGNIISVALCSDALIDSVFDSNTQGNNVISTDRNSKLLIENSIFTNNVLHNVILSIEDNLTISGCTFADNVVGNVMYSENNNLSVLGSTFSTNTLSGNGALFIRSNLSATVDDCIFAKNNADNYRNIYSESTNVKITNTTFDAINVDYTVRDIDYGKNETIEGTIDIGTNLNFTANLDINGKIYSVNVTDSKFTYNLKRPSAGDYHVVIDAEGGNSNNFIFDKITRIFTVNPVEQILDVTINDITYGEKLNVTVIANKPNTLVFELNGTSYNNETLQNLTLAPGDYLIIAISEGDKNYLPASVAVHVKVHKAVPNITVNDVAVSYGDEIRINVTTDVADYYTVFLDNRYDESVSLYVENSAIFTFNGLDYEPGSYEITVYVFESDDYAEAYAYATLTVNKAVGFFNLSNDLIIEGENATVDVEVPVNAYGNITYKVYDRNMNLVYNITQSCLEVLVVPNLDGGRYIVTGTFEGDSYYTNSSRVNSGTIFVRESIDINITVSNITYGENANVTVKSNVDGEYLVHVGTDSRLVPVINGIGNVPVPNLSAGIYAVNVTVVDGNYSGFNETVFEVAPKPVSVAVSVEDIVFGENATVIVNGEIDGEYIVEIYGQNYTVNVTGGKGNTTIDDLASGEDILVSVTIADGNYNATNTTTFNVFSKYNTPIELDIVTDENYVGMTVTVSDAATGLVKFQISGAEEYVVYTDVINGIAILEDTLETGDYTVVATYMGSDRFNTNITHADFTIKGHIKKNTTINAQADVNGNRVTLTVKVNENATGFVEVKSGDSVSNIALENGEGTLTIALPYGSYSLDITYLGDENYNKNSTKCEFTLVEPEKQYTPISLDIVTDENYVGMTVTVSDAATGLVKFQVSGAEEYVVYSDVINGIAILEDTLETGDYTVVATYMGSDWFNTNITHADFTIKGHIKKNTTINAQADVIGNRVTLTVTVDEDATGFVKLTVGSTVTNIEVVDGVATLTTILVPNSYFVDVTYLGDDNFNMNNTGVTFTITDVSKTNTTIDLNIITYEDSALIVVDLNETATGLVKFYMVSKETGENYAMYMDVVDGHVETFTNSIEPGNYTVVATYMGDSVFNTNTTSKDVEIIGHIMKNTPIDVTVESKANIVTLNVKVNENATGFVEIKSGDTVSNIALENGEGTLTIALPYGSYSLDITYLGDENYNKNSTKCEFTLVEPGKEYTPISLDIVTDENHVEMTVTVSDAATGLVKFEVTGPENYTLYAEVKDGKAILEDILTAGDYSVLITYLGDDNFNSNMTSAEFTISDKQKEDTNVTIDIPSDVKAGEDAKVTVSIPGATGNISVIVDGVENVVPLDENGTASYTIPAVGVGDHSVVVVYPGDETHNAAYATKTFSLEGYYSNFTNVTIAEDLNITANLVNSLGDPIANATIKYSVGDVNGTVTTDENGLFTIAGKEGEVVTIEYDGSDVILPTSISITLKDITPVRAASMFNVTDGTSIPTYAVDFGVGERGKTVAFKLTDANGNPIANATVNFAYKTVYFNRTTDENGIVSIGISTQIAGEYLCALSYLGDETHNATFVPFNFNIQKKAITISASAKTFKSKAKTKKYTVTLKTKAFNSKDGKVYLKAGKKVTLKINGKTYKAKTNAKGQATFSLKITKKGKFTGKISFAGDITYKAASKSVKLTIK